MNDSTESHSGTVPTIAVVVLSALAVLGVLLQTGALSLLNIAMAFSHVGQLVLIAISAGGLGYLILRKVMPKSAPLGLRLVSAIGLGLWLLSTLVLMLGSLGMLWPWLWWTIQAIGLLAAGFQGKDSIGRLAIPNRLPSRALIAVLLAAAGALWISGATSPPGLFSLDGDSFDVLEYHLQLPREYLLAGRVMPLEHNVYSFFPSGTEMLFLLGMILRGGSYEGMYLATMMPGLFLALTAAAALGAMRGQEASRGTFAAAFLATSPYLLYLSYQAMAELPGIFYLTLALLWLRHWLSHKEAGSAALIGLAIGGACATKYLAVGFVAAPVLAVMFLSSLVSLRRLPQVALAAVLALALMSPWLIRNTAATGNPVFPLLTEQLGAGHWSQESQQRWQDGHGRQNMPPVPIPPQYSKPPQQPNRLVALYTNFIGSDRFNLLLIITTVIGISVVLAGGRNSQAWEYWLIVILVMQVVVWSQVTHGMPSRFIVPALVPMCMLASGAIWRLSELKTNPFKRNAQPSPRGPWGLPLAVATTLAVVIVGLISALNMLQIPWGGSSPERFLPGQIIATQWWPVAPAWKLPPSSRIALIGESQAFYLPPGTIYATAFDSDSTTRPIALKNDPRETIAALKADGVTHILVNWQEIARLATTYGYPRPYVGNLLQRRREQQAVGNELIESLGLKLVEHVGLPPPPQSTTATAPATLPAATQSSDRFQLVDYHGTKIYVPILSLYELP